MAIMPVPIEVSARHVHLSEVHLVALFGNWAKLTQVRAISQPGQFAAEEQVEVIGPKGKLLARVVGPVRKETQVELSITDCHLIGIPVTIALSGMLAGTVGAILRGPAGEVVLDQGVFVPERHLHVSADQAKNLGLKDGDRVHIQVTGQRAVTFHNVCVRARKNIDELSFMLDYDEANAAGIDTRGVGYLLVD